MNNVKDNNVKDNDVKDNDAVLSPEELLELIKNLNSPTLSEEEKEAVWEKLKKANSTIEEKIVEIRAKLRTELD